MNANFITFGCRLNQYDSEWLREEFELVGTGLKPTSTSSFSNGICVINTCAVTSRACREARNTIRTEAKKTPKPFIIVTGCYAKISPNEISQIDGVELVEPDPKKIVTEFLSQVAYEKVPLLPGIRSFSAHDKAFVKVQEGCDQFCSYCIVPYARGKPQNRGLQEIVNEVTDLVQNGYEEIILTGTNLGKCKNLLQIIEAIEKVEGVRRVGFGSLEPMGISDELLDFVQSSPKFSRYFHIPLQSGDNKILKLMGRWYSCEEYIELVYKIKEKMPDCAIGADVIIGFPGEGEQEFLNTYNSVANSPISRLHVFRYSKRPYTRALELAGEPPDSTKKERGRILLELSKEKWAKFRSQFIDKTLEAHIELAEKPNEFIHSSDNRWLVGVTKNYIKVLFKPTKSLQAQRTRQPHQVCIHPYNSFVELRIKKVDGALTYGELVS